MASLYNRLTAKAVEHLERPGRHADGGGLYLSISKNGGRRWVFLFRWQGKPTEMGLGSARNVKLARARELASNARSLVAEGVNPMRAKASPAAMTFGAAADEFIDQMSPSWRNDKHLAQWKMTLREYAKSIRSMDVSDVDTPAVLKVLKPIWTDKPETASRLRGRIERVLDAAKVKGLRSGENPARWRGHLDHLLPPRQVLSRGHHKALSYEDLPDFMAKLRERRGTAAAALRFVILNAARSGEVRGATHAEFDLAKAIWIIPAERMKAGREHRVPLSKQSVDLLRELGIANGAGLIFTGSDGKRPMSVMAMDMLLRRMKYDVTVHGFRSTFRDWAAEQTATPNEVCEAALAHVIGDRVEAAYRRGDLFEKRRLLMDDWSTYCASTKVVHANEGIAA